MWLRVQARAVPRVLHTGALSQRTTGLKCRWVCLGQAQRSLECTFSALLSMLSIEILLLQNIWGIASPFYTLPVAFSTTVFIRMWEHNKTLNCTEGVTVTVPCVFSHDSDGFYFFIGYLTYCLNIPSTFFFFSIESACFWWEIMTEKLTKQYDYLWNL